MSPVSSTAGSFVRSGKVRDLYAIGEDRLLLVASDRLSAFDVVLPTEIPDKGRVLTGLSRFWFSRTESIVPNHLLAAAPEDLPAEMAWDQDASRELRGRIMLCRRADVLPIEVIVRGYITGSGWKDYQRTGAVCGIALPAGLKESERLPEPLFTPSTKAEVGHDENIDLAEAARLVGADMALRVRDVAIELGVPGAVDRGHAALTKQLDQAVPTAERGPDLGHGLGVSPLLRPRPATAGILAHPSVATA